MTDKTLRYETFTAVLSGKVFKVTDADGDYIGAFAASESDADNKSILRQFILEYLSDEN